MHTHIAHVFICISFFYSWQESGTRSQSRNASKQLAMNWRDFSFETSYRHSESSTMNEDVHVTYSLTRRSSTTMLHVIDSMPRRVPLYMHEDRSSCIRTT